MNEEYSEDVFRKYDENLMTYHTFGKKLCSLVEEILLSNSIRVHSITYRIKERKSLVHKITKSEEKYKQCGDVTDIVGVRIITFFADDVDEVARVIESEFRIDPENSIDKRAVLDPDRFGYLSLHYVVQLSENRRTLTEYCRFPDFKAEIQIRSILQHAWAEIEHDLGYKTKLAVPAQIIRRFSRLAGLLELGDQEFIAIREELKKYEDEIPKKMIEMPQNVQIDKVSLRIFIKTNHFLKLMDLKIMELFGAKVQEDPPDERIEHYIKLLKYFGIKTIAELENKLRSHADDIVSFAKNWISDMKHDSLILIGGTTLLYVVFVFIGQKGDVMVIRDILDSASIGRTSERHEIAEKVLSTYERAVLHRKPS